MAAFSLNDKVIAVTGAASGIGFATSLLLASRGASLSLADIRSSALHEAKERILSKTPAASILTCEVDVQSSEQVEGWIRQTVARFGRLDAAANVAGIVPRSIFTDAGLIENIDGEEWDQVMNVNLKGTMHCMKWQLRAMKSGGSLVNTSSIAGLSGRAKNGIYVTSKHGVIGLTKTAAKECGPGGIRVNCICPGRIDTQMTIDTANSAVGGGDKDFVADMVKGIALRRAGAPEEVAKVIAFLLSDESSYITGASIPIDGGWLC